MRLVAALEREAFVAKRPRPLGRDDGRLEWRGRLVVRGGVRQPSRSVYSADRVGHLPATRSTSEVGTGRQPRLVHATNHRSVARVDREVRATRGAREGALRASVPRRHRRYDVSTRKAAVRGDTVAAPRTPVATKDASPPTLRRCSRPRRRPTSVIRTIALPPPLRRKHLRRSNSSVTRAVARRRGRWSRSRPGSTNHPCTNAPKSSGSTCRITSASAPTGSRNGGPRLREGVIDGIGHLAWVSDPCRVGELVVELARRRSSSDRGTTNTGTAP